MLRWSWQLWSSTIKHFPPLMSWNTIILLSELFVTFWVMFLICCRSDYIHIWVVCFEESYIESLFGCGAVMSQKTMRNLEMISFDFRTCMMLFIYSLVENYEDDKKTAKFCADTNTLNICGKKEKFCLVQEVWKMKKKKRENVICPKTS